jgi:hypothetical protein
MAILGVDLGTAFARAAVSSERGPRLLSLPDGSPNLPAVVAYSKGAPRVGQAAVEKAAIHPELTVRGVKRLLGREAADPLVAAIARFAPYGVIPRDGEGLALVVDGERREAEDVAAAILAQLATLAEESTGVRPEAAVLTTPHWFGARQRRALDEAARRAGLSARQIVSEGTAIAISLAGPEQRRIAVADVGAGGVTVSIAETGAARVVLLGCAGDPAGGGDDIDRGILAAALEGIRRRWGDFPDQPALHEMLRQTCEGLKRDLGEMNEVRAVIPFLPVGPRGLRHEEIRLDRAHFAPLLEDTRARVERAVHEALAQAQMPASALALVVAAGGLSRVREVRAAIERSLGPITAKRFDPDAAVALGAAMHGAMMEGSAPSIPVVDVHLATLPPPPMPPSIPPAQVRTAPPAARSSAPPAQRSSVPPASSASAPPAEEEPSEELRLTVASLLASVRAGAVTELAPARTRRLVRVNEPMDADDLEGSEKRAEMAQRLTAIWNQLGLTMLAARQYRWDHQLTKRQLGAALREIEAALAAAPHGVRFDVTSTCFAYDRKAVWKPDKAPLGRVPQQLFSDGLRAVQWKAGIDAAELTRFLTVLITVAAGTDEDAVSALWEQRLSRVAHLAVDAFVEADSGHVDREREDLIAELTRAGGVDLEATLGTLWEGRRESVEHAAALTLPTALIDDLSRRAAVPEEVLRARQLAAFPAAKREAERYGDMELLHAALRAYADERVARGDLEEMFATVADLAAAFEAEEGAGAAAVAERDLTRVMLPRPALMALFQRLGDAPLEEAGARSLARALSLAGDATLYDEARSAYWAGDGAVREALLPYLLEASAGHEGALGRIVRDASEPHGLAALKRLTEMNTVPARAALHEAFESPHLTIRIAAITHLPEASAETVRAELTRLLEDPEPAVRLRALSVVGQLHAAAAGPLLVRRIQGPAMATLPLAERRLLLTTLAQLSPRRAEAVALALLGESHLLPSQAIDDTRIIAAEVLGGVGGPEAMAALLRTAQRRWLNTTGVRDAAAQAAQAVATRLGVPLTGAS